MLVEFKFKNYRSFRDEAVLSMEATGLGNLKNVIIPFGSLKLLPGVAIYGKNGGGKSNVIRAFWLAVQFIKNAQKTQHEKANVPVLPFALNDYSCDEPTGFEFIYILNGCKYWYGFEATREKVVSEYLYHSPNRQKALIFSRKNQEFVFTEDKAKRKLISSMVAENQLFFSIACTMNDPACVNAMQWFREKVYFSQNYSDIPHQLLEYSDDANMLKAISNYAKAADVGIEDLQFEVNNEELNEDLSLPDNMPEDLKNALKQLMHSLTEMSNSSNINFQMGEVKTTAKHMGVDKKGKSNLYNLDISDESDGTRRLMSIAPAIESTLDKGGLLIVDEIEQELHPRLVNYIVAKFQSKNTNPNGAQIIFTTHNTELLSMELLRKDQFYFVDKDRTNGTSDLYSISDFSTRTTDNVRKGYLLGKYGAIPNIEIEEIFDGT